jgi:LmbE family N-acetylglucosaminyl deacetylase
MTKNPQSLLGKWYRFSALAAVKVPIRLYFLLRRKNFTPALISLPPGKNILVFAPHMDDEIIGCGGTLHKHVRAGAKVTVAYMTAGKKSHHKIHNKASESKKTTNNQHEFSELRKQEARKASSVIGIDKLIFLDYSERNLSPSKKVIESVSSILQSTNPDLIYVPFLTDPHHDHWMTNRILVQSLKRTNKFATRPMCCGYEVWNPVYPNCIVDISDVVDIKKRALEQYGSQLDHNNYIKSIFGLNSYRSIILGGQSYAEAFVLTSSKAYIRMYEAMRA